MLTFAKTYVSAISVVIVFILNCGRARALNEGNTCSMKNGTQGTCMKLPECQSIETALKEGRFPLSDLVLCGFAKNEIEIVCCPEELVNERPKPINGAGPTATNRCDCISQKACVRYTEKYRKPLGFNILGGDPAEPGEFPHMAALGYPSSKAGEILDFNCGGTLISDRYVLTAAHCVLGRDSQPEVVRLGTIDLTEPKIDAGVENIIMHPNYKSSRQYDDIALIRLNTSVQFTSFIYPACLSTDPSYESNKVVIATGWGTSTVNTRRKSNILLKVNLTTIEIGECNKMHTGYGDNRRLPNGLNEGHLCAGDFSTRKNRGDTCEGDSGGPLQLAGSNPATIVGITSFGIVCGSYIPSVYARIATYLNWIEGIVWSDLN